MEKENLTKQYIYEAFFNLLKTNNYDKISVCDITQKAGVSRMSFYRNFNSKEDLLNKGFDCLLSQMKKQVEESNQTNIYTITKIIFETLRKFKDILPSFNQSAVTHKIMETIPTKLKENTVSDYMNKANKYIPVFYYGAITTILFDWLKNGAEEEPEEMAKLIASLINIDINDENF